MTSQVGDSLGTCSADVPLCAMLQTIPSLKLGYYRYAYTCDDQGELSSS